MKERPILFKGDMVRAILDGRKTMTRRVIKPQPVPIDDAGRRTTYAWRDGLYALQFYPDKSDILAHCPYGKPGDRLWVRENAYYWGCWKPNGITRKGKQKWKAVIDRSILPLYRAGEVRPKLLKKGDAGIWWIFRPAMFMPRWASRITLEIVNIRVERVQDISKEDAKAEGMTRELRSHLGYSGEISEETFNFTQARDTFRILWDSLNAKRGYGWDANPWVWVIGFRKIQ